MSGVPMGTDAQASTPPGAADPLAVLATVTADLDLLDELSTDEQVAVYGRVHSALTTALAATAGARDSSGPPAPGGGR